MLRSFDVVVVGGGPSGSVAANVLSAQGISVVVCERSTYFKAKPGECLSPGGTRVLQALRLDFNSTDHVRCIGVKSAWASSDLVERQFMLEPNGYGWQLDRAAFDCSLAKAAITQGATWIGGSRLVKAKAQANRWHLVFRDKTGRVFEITGRFVIDASGRAARFSRLAGGFRQSFDNLTAQICMFDSALGDDCHENRLWAVVEATADGWWYSALLPNGHRLVTKFTDVDLIRSIKPKTDSHSQISRNFLAQIQETTNIHRFIGALRMLSVPRVCVASTAKILHEKSPVGNWLAVGDAAFTLDPITSHGLTNAISTGYYGACASLDYLNGDETATLGYQDMIDSQFQCIIELIENHYRTETRWPLSTFWSRRLATRA